MSKGTTGRVRIRRKDVIAWQVTQDVKVQDVRVRQPWLYPPEFKLQAFALIDDQEIEQSSADILDEKFQDLLEAMMVKEDRITKALLDRASTTYNSPVGFTSFNPAVFTSLRTQVRRWGVGNPAMMIAAFDIWDDIIADPDFVAWWDPITKHELVLEGSLGRLLGIEILTDGFRYPTLAVLNPGEVYVTSSPMTLGSKIIRKELDSRAVDQYNLGRAARGWFMHMIESLIIANPRGVSVGRRLLDVLPGLAEAEM